MTPEQIKDKYQDRIFAFLQKMRDALRTAEHACEEPYEDAGDEYHWCMLMDRRWGGCGGVEVSFVIIESEDDGEEDSVNFSVEVEKWGGEILGIFTPRNYTPECWVSRNDEDAVEKRFRMVERIKPQDLIDTVEGR